MRWVWRKSHRAEHQHIDATQTLNLAGVDVADVGDVGHGSNTKAHDGHGAVHHGDGLHRNARHVERGVVVHLMEPHLGRAGILDARRRKGVAEIAAHSLGRAGQSPHIHGAALHPVERPHIVETRNVVAMLVGEQYTIEAVHCGSQHRALCDGGAAHDSPLSASNGFLGCHHFSQTNEYLQKQNIVLIDWIIQRLKQRYLRI